MFHYRKNMLPNIFDNFFLSKQTLKLWGLKIWNQIPLKIRNTKSSHSFISKLIPYLNKNQLSCNFLN